MLGGDAASRPPHMLGADAASLPPLMLGSNSRSYSPYPLDGEDDSEEVGVDHAALSPYPLHLLGSDDASKPAKHDAQGVLGGDAASLPPHMLGGDAASLPPHMLGGDAASLPPHMLGGDAASLPPHMLGGDAASLPPQMLGADPAVYSPYSLGVDAASLPPKHMLGGDASSLPPQQLLGADELALPPLNSYSNMMFNSVYQPQGWEEGKEGGKPVYTFLSHEAPEHRDSYAAQSVGDYEDEEDVDRCQNALDKLDQVFRRKYHISDQCDVDVVDCDIQVVAGYNYSMHIAIDPDTCDDHRQFYAEVSEPGPWEHKAPTLGKSRQLKWVGGQGSY